MTDVVALCAELLSIQSPTGREGKIVELVSRRLVSRGWNVTVQEVTPGRGNIWASRGGGGITLSTNLDTVTTNVSPGLGTTFVPFRFFARPEVTELVLRSTS